MPADTRTYSLEFFPPKTAHGFEKLHATWQAFAPFAPAFFSCTHGAGGSTRDRTLETVLDIQSAGFVAVPHLSCIGATRADVATTLDTYQAHGIRHIVALRGDLLSGETATGAFQHANELVAFIRRQTGEHFHLTVACYPEFHPQAPSARHDLESFRRKVESGADGAITQYFFNADAYFRFVDACDALDINVPIVPGIMPIGNFTQLARFSERCGAEIPRWLRMRMDAFGDDLCSMREYGLDVVTDLCDRLLAAGAPGLHFYTLNEGALTSAIWRRLGLSLPHACALEAGAAMGQG